MDGSTDQTSTRGELSHQSQRERLTGHGMMVHNESGPAVRKHPGPDTEGMTSMHADPTSRECPHLTLEPDPETGARTWVLAQPRIGRPDHGWFLLGGVCASCGEDLVRAAFYERVLGINDDGTPRGIATRGGAWTTTETF